MALNTDDSIHRIKGEGRPVKSLASRIYMLSMFEFVDYIVFFDEDTPLALIQKIRPDIIVKGGDYKVEEVVGHEQAEVRLFPHREGLSTTNIVLKIKGSSNG